LVEGIAEVAADGGGPVIRYEWSVLHDECVAYLRGVAF